MTLRHPIYATRRPVAIPRLGKITKALKTLYGDGLTMTEFGVAFVFWTPGDSCPCFVCDEAVRQTIRLSPGFEWHDAMDRHMIVCPDCGNKRCPQAASHENWCTRSNATGQMPALKVFDPNPLEVTP